MTGPALFVPHFCCSEVQYLTESLGVWALSIFPAPYKELLKVYMSLSTLSYEVLICPQKQALLGKGDFQKFLAFPDPTHLSIQPFAFEFLLFSHSL